MLVPIRRRTPAARPDRGDPRADVAAGVGLLAAGAAVTAAVVLPRSRWLVQRVDERWYRLVQAHRHASLGRASRALDVALGTTVDWTVRLGVTGLLVRQRRWRALAGWATTVALGEVSIGPVKARIERPRPLEPLTRTSMTSYPSGHAIAAATTCPGIVLALLPPGPRRERWLDAAVAVAAATALSRTYLNAHWLSDTAGGFCLGTGFSLLVPRIVDAVVDSVVDSVGGPPTVGRVRPDPVRRGRAPARPPAPPRSTARPRSDRTRSTRSWTSSPGRSNGEPRRTSTSSTACTCRSWSKPPRPTWSPAPDPPGA